MIHIDPSFATALHGLFAIAGGGGSGGGGGGGGSGGSGGGVVALGFIATYLPATWARRNISILAGWIVGSLAVLIVIFLCIVAIGGGTDKIGDSVASIAIIIGAFVGIASAMKNPLAFLAQRIKQGRAKMQQAAARDGAWQEAAITNRVTKVFIDYQRDWSSFNFDNIKTYTTPRYYGYTRLLMLALLQLGRQNVVGEPKLSNPPVVIDVDDEANNNNDRFTAFINGTAKDQLVRTADKQVLHYELLDVREYWKFDRDGDTWLLDGIDQTTADANSSVQSLRNFAQQNGLYYSLDMGRLLLPERGQLFNKANFSCSDVNNHVIGEWEGLLVQMYTYIQDTSAGKGRNYLIGQISLPKSYGGIIIQRKQSWQWRFRWLLGLQAPKGYQPVSMEWQDFNQRYNVYATDLERITSFELLNPAYMARLYDANLPVSIEVVDNVVYFYTLVTTTDQSYAAMLTILQGAFQELKR